MGFIERAGFIVCGGLPLSEMPLLTSVVGLSREEQELLGGWQDSPAWDTKEGREAPPPGLGNFLVKVGGQPGSSVDRTLTAAKKQLHVSAARWTDRSRTGLLGQEPAP